MHGIVNSVNTTSTNTSTVGEDQSNWNSLSQYMTNSAQRTLSRKLNVFSKILLANMKARSKFLEARSLCITNFEVYIEVRTVIFLVHKLPNFPIFFMHEMFVMIRLKQF